MKNWIAFTLGGVLAAGTVWFIMRPAAAPEPPPQETAAAVAPVVPAVPLVEAPPPPPAPPARQKTSKPFAPPASSKARVLEPAQATPPPPAPEPAPAPRPPTPPAVNQEVATPPQAASPVKAPTPPPRAARAVTIAEGTLITVRLSQSLSSESNVSGDTFQATLDEPLVIDGLVIAEKGSRAEGKVVTAEKAGRTRGVAKLAIELLEFHTADGQKIKLQTTEFSKDGPTSQKDDAAKIGVGAGIGAAIGAIAGGGKGAAIGAAAGGATGTGVVLGTRGKPAELDVETRISFRLRQPVSVTEKLR